MRVWVYLAVPLIDSPVVGATPDTLSETVGLEGEGEDEGEGEGEG